VVYNEVKDRGEIMVRKANETAQMIFVGTMLFFALLFDLVLFRNSDTTFNVIISVGISTGYLAVFGKKMYAPIILVTTLGTYLISVIILATTDAEAIFLILSMLFLNMVGPTVFLFILKRFNFLLPDNMKKGYIYIFATFVTTSILSLAAGIQYMIVNGSPFFLSIHLYANPLTVGLSIFSVLIIYSHYYDEYLTTKTFANLKDIIYVLIFTTSTILIFVSTSDDINFANYAPIFIFLFMFNAFKFNYRMLFYSVLTFFLVYNYVLNFANTQTIDIPPASINVFIFSIVLITIFTKVLVQLINTRNDELNETKESYSKMLDSTYNLMRLGDSLTTEITYHEQYLNNVFDIAKDIFSDVDSALCIIKEGQSMRFVNAYQYDFEKLKHVHLNTTILDWTSTTPVIKMSPSKDIKSIMGENYHHFADLFDHVQVSVYIRIRLSYNQSGIIIFEKHKDNESTFSSNDIENISSFQKLVNSLYEKNELTIINNNLRDDIVLSLIRTLELYDEYTGGHSEDVAFLAKMIAEEMRLPTQTISDIYWAGIVHDIGKVGINPSILNKNGKLTNEEYEIMKQHPVAGYNILSRSKDLIHIAKLVRHHHEWWNGSGYPDRFSKDQIPLGSQILQLADSVCAMATKRSYKEQKSFTEILKEIDLYDGVQFSPKICKIMKKLINENKVQKLFTTE
jgi:HD-GYP domain-containing protein (c-di-GMP phosphodiesterase class II)